MLNRCIQVGIALGLVFDILLGARALASERPPWVLSPGEQRQFRAPGLSRYSLGGGAVRGRSSHDSIMIKAVQPGRSDLWVWRSDGSSVHQPIEVSKGSPLPASSQTAMTRALSRLNEVGIVYAGDGRIILTGEIQSLEEAARVRALRPQVEDQTRLAARPFREGRERLETWLRQSGPPTLRLEERDDQLWIRGSLDRPSEYASVLRQIRSRFPWAEVEIETLPDASPTVHFQVYLLELKRSGFRNLGISWPKAIQGAYQLSPVRGWGSSQLEIALQALEGDGSAQILSRPELVVRAPGEAELFAGGELPIQTTTRFQSNVSWKNFGLTLRLKVAGSTGDRVRLEVFTEVSHLDSTLALNEIPGIQANRMKTQVDARYGSPLFLSGLLQKGHREQARGLPALRRIPILGLLFGSEDYLSERSELVAILVPMSTPPRAEIERFDSLRSVDSPRLERTEETAPARTHRTADSQLIPQRIEHRSMPGAHRSATHPRGLRPYGRRR